MELGKVQLDVERKIMALVAASWQYAAEQPENSLTADVFGAGIGAVQTGLAVAWASAATAR
ncbi:hypothetical protein GCM10028822_05170 [Hymenobacter terrigena]